MPSSFVDSYPPIVKLLIDWQPNQVIDIGPGWGKYGLACREYLPSINHVDAIEVPPGRLPAQDVIYDHVYTGDARECRAGFFEVYDMALIIDVIEHMSLEDGHELLERILKDNCRAIVSTPKVFVNQHDDHNPYETHVSCWTWEDFVPHGIKVDVSTIDSIIYLLKGQ